MIFYNVFTDGSYSKDDSNHTHGGIVFGDENNKVLSRIHVVTSIKDFTSMNNVGGEILAAWSAILSVVSSVKQANEEKGLEQYQLTLVYDYEGVGKWITGEWRAKKKATQWYRESVKKLVSSVPNLKVRFIWVKGHEDTYLNHAADYTAAYNLNCEAEDIPKCDLDDILTEDYGFRLE